MIPREQWKTWKPTPDMIRAAENCFAAMAFVETIRPIVEGYQKRILADMRPLYAREWRDKGLHGSNEVILNPDHTYLMEESDFRIYISRCNEERIKAGLHVDNPEFCPLLTAEHIQMEAEHAMIDAMVPATGITREKIWNSSHALENNKKLINLTLRMMAQFCNTKQTMRRFAA